MRLKDKSVRENQKRTTKNLFFFVCVCVLSVWTKKKENKRKCGKEVYPKEGREGMTVFFLLTMSTRKEKNGDRLIYIDLWTQRALQFHPQKKEIVF